MHSITVFIQPAIALFQCLNLLLQEELQCQFVEWMDDPWPPRVQETLNDLWRELRVTKRCEATANASLIEAVRETIDKERARAALQEEVERTKRFAERACTSYHRKAVLAVVDKSKLMYLIYCLVGVIAILVTGMMRNMK